MDSDTTKKFDALTEVVKQANTLDKTLTAISHWELGNDSLDCEFWDAHNALQHVVTRYTATLNRKLNR